MYFTEICTQAPVTNSPTVVNIMARPCFKYWDKIIKNFSDVVPLSYCWGRQEGQMTYEYKRIHVYH